MIFGMYLIFVYIPWMISVTGCASFTVTCLFTLSLELSDIINMFNFKETLSTGLILNWKSNGQVVCDHLMAGYYNIMEKNTFPAQPYTSQTTIHLKLRKLNNFFVFLHFVHIIT